MKPGILLRVRQGLAGSVALAVVAAAFLAAPAPAAGELFRIGGAISTLLPGGTWRGVETAYDPVLDVYLVVVAYGDVRGVFTNGAGTPITEAFTIDNGSFGHFPNAEYSPHVSNGSGGSGGFIVVWNDSSSGNSIRARIVALHAPGRLVSGVQMVSDPGHGTVFFENRPVVAYSQSSGRFLVAWTTASFGIQARLVNTNGAPFGGVFRFEEGGSRDPAVIWNPATDEFGVGNTGWGGGGAFAVFRLVRAADGAVHSRTTFGFGGGTYSTGLDVNSANQYVFTWGLHPGTISALFNHNGALLGTNFVSGRIGGDLSMGLAFNPTTGTFLVVSSDWASLDVAGAELSASGAPMSAAVQLTAEHRASYYPLPAARRGTNQWNVVYTPNYLGATNQLVSSNGLAGTSSPPPSGGSSSGCSTPDPFVSIGGGTCVNGGWLPGGGGSSPPPPPPPPPPAPSAGCTTPDPFVSIGGGTCVNGGWIPGGSAPAPAPAPAPPPPPAPSSCASPQPGAGWVCAGGGWLPPGHPDAAGVVSSGGSAGGCTTPDPFASIGGGTCSAGGWVPGPGSSCGTPDPFASLGGGICINGGWTPGGM